MKLTFKIHPHHEPGVGIDFYGDTVTIEVKSGDPGGDPGEFAERMKEALESWYDFKVDLMPSKHGCYIDIDANLIDAEVYQECVLDDKFFSGKQDCDYAIEQERSFTKEKCKYWRPL